MIRINLIPHRAAFRQQQIIEYIITFVTAVCIAIALIILVDMSSTEDLTALKEERATLQSKNIALTKVIGELRNLDSLREEVEGKLQIVDELQAGRFRSLLTLEGIVVKMPQNIWLTKFSDANGVLSFSGFGESSQAIANFMRALERSDLFSDVKLTFDKTAKVEGANVRSFALTLRRLTLSEQEAKAKSKEVVK